MKNIKRIVSIFLSVVFSLSSFGMVSAEKTDGDLARNEDTKNYCIEKGIWKNGEFEEDRAVTRGEFAGMIGRAIGVAETGVESGFADVSVNDVNFKEISALSSLNIIAGHNGYFRPHDTITREETAVIIERIYKDIYGYFEYDTGYYKDTRFLDFADISDWAVQSIVNVCDAGIMLARAGRRFEPKVNTTVLEAANLAKDINNVDHENHIFSVSDPVGEPSQKYSVYQKVKITPQGVSGAGLVGRFSKAPEEIYISRTTVKPEFENSFGNPASPVTFARVIDPDGIAVARVDLNYVESGKMAKVINITSDKAGIWQIELVNGRRDDVVEFGVNGATSWGLRGEPSFRFTETTPNELYFWVPEKFTDVDIGTSVTASIRNLNDENIISSTAQSASGYTTNRIYTANLTPNEVYKLVFAPNSGSVLAINGISSLVCPTAEMAADLRGNYHYTDDGMQLHGPLQKKAREAAVKLSESRGGNFDVVIERPEELPVDDIKNPIGESATLPAIAAMNETLQDQYLADISSPLYGAMVGRDKVRGTTALQTDTWETGQYNTYFNSTRFQGAIDTNAVINYFYGNQALIDRATLWMLNTVHSTTDFMTMMDKTPSVKQAGHNYYFTHSNFYLEWMTDYFLSLKDYIDPEYRAIIQEGIEQMTDKQMNFRGNGPSNQYAHGVSSALWMWLATGEERYHEYFKRSIVIYTRENSGGYSWNGLGQTSIGYFIENGGADGNYNHMNTNPMAHYYADYCLHPEADPETVALITESVERMLKFDSMFYGHRVEGLETGAANHFTSRTDSTVSNRGGQQGFTSVNKYFGTARRMFEVTDIGENDYPMIFGHLVSEESTAWYALNKAWEKYDHYFDGSTRAAQSSSMYDYYWDREDWAEAEKLPYEEEGIYELPGGTVSVNHKGLYVLSFYNDARPEGINVAGMSWYGGGPSLITSENTAGVVSSRRPANSVGKSVIGGVAEVLQSCIYGTNSDGSFFVSGKEEATLTWLEENKKFVISGTGVGNGKTISWTYELTDEGVTITPSIGAIKTGEEFWVNIPVTKQTNEQCITADEAGKLSVKFGEAESVIEWDPSLTYDFTDTGSSSVKCLRIKLPASGSAELKFSTK